VKKAQKSGVDGGEGIVSGDEAFTLHDTYGFPIELTLEMAEEQGVEVDEAKFRELMAEQKSRARADALSKRHNVDLSVYDDFKKTLDKPLEFLGYTDFFKSFPGSGHHRIWQGSGSRGLGTGLLSR
jgi:alanyl-tRNA synthetase